MNWRAVQECGRCKDWIRRLGAWYFSNYEYWERAIQSASRGSSAPISSTRMMLSTVRMNWWSFLIGSWSDSEAALDSHSQKLSQTRIPWQCSPSYRCPHSDSDRVSGSERGTLSCCGWCLLLRPSGALVANPFCFKRFFRGTWRVLIGSGLIFKCYELSVRIAIGERI